MNAVNTNEREFKNPFSAIGLAAKVTRAFWQQGGNPDLLNCLAEDVELNRMLVLLLQNRLARNMEVAIAKAMGQGPIQTQGEIPAMVEFKLGQLLKLRETNILVPSQAPARVAERLANGAKIGKFTINHETEKVLEIFPPPSSSIHSFRVNAYSILSGVIWDSFMVKEIGENTLLTADEFYSLVCSTAESTESGHPLRVKNNIVPLLNQGKKYTAWFNFFGERLEIGIGDFDTNTWLGGYNQLISQVPDKAD